MARFIFVVEHFLPSSEHGGLAVVIAKDSEEVFNLLYESGKITCKKEPKHQWMINELRDQLRWAIVYELKEETASGIVKNFQA